MATKAIPEGNDEGTVLLKSSEILQQKTMELQSLARNENRGGITMKITINF